MPHRSISSVRPGGSNLFCVELMSDDGVLMHMLGFQEALVRQVHDLDELLGSEFAWVGALFLRATTPSFPPTHIIPSLSFYRLLGNLIY